MDKNETVLLTGVSGFLGSHTAIQLLEKGYHVIGTLRNMDRAESIRGIIGQGSSKVTNLQFAKADLQEVQVWQDLCQGVDYVQHIASPFPRVLPKREADLIGPARDGTLNVVQAAAARGVKRVVLTSSTGAIVYGRPKARRAGLYTEADWTDFTNKKDSTPYFRSKTIAEQAAWDFIEQNEVDLELTSVCPGAILGPVLEQDFGTSASIVVKILEGSIPAVPDIGFDIVDVRSVADLLVRAMELPVAKNQRYIASSGYMKFKEIADVLRQRFPDRKIPKGTLPNLLVRLISNFETSLKPILIDLGVERRVDNTKAKTELQWDPIGKDEAVIACAESILELGILS